MMSNVRTSGPIFSNGIERRFKKTMREGLAAIVLHGEGDVKRQLYPGHGLITGALRESVGGHVVSDTTGQIDAGQISQGRNIGYAAFIEGVSPKNRTTRFKGYHMFENTAGRLGSLDLDKFLKDRLVRVLGG